MPSRPRSGGRGRGVPKPSAQILLDGLVTADDVARLERKLDALLDAIKNNQAAPQSALLDRRGAAKELGVSESTIDAAVKAGELIAVRIGSSVRFRRADLDAYVDSRTVGAPVGGAE